MTEQNKNIKDKKGGNPKGPTPPKFNFYWIYGIIMVGLLVMTFLPKQEGSKTNLKAVLEMVERNDVEKIIVNNDRFIQVFLTQEALENERYKDVKPNKGLLGAKTPQYEFESNFEYFVAELEKLPVEVRNKVELEMGHSTRSIANSWLCWFGWRTRW